MLDFDLENSEKLTDIDCQYAEREVERKEEEKDKLNESTEKDNCMQQENDAAIKQESKQLLKEAPTTDDEYIAVAYQDSWYSDIVEGTFNDLYIV